MFIYSNKTVFISENLYAVQNYVKSFVLFRIPVHIKILNLCGNFFGIYIHKRSHAPCALLYKYTGVLHFYRLVPLIQCMATNRHVFVRIGLGLNVCFAFRGTFQHLC